MVFTVALALFPDQAVVIIHLPAALPNSIMEVCGRRCIILVISQFADLCQLVSSTLRCNLQHFGIFHRAFTTILPFGFGTSQTPSPLS